MLVPLTQNVYAPGLASSLTWGHFGNGTGSAEYFIEFAFIGQRELDTEPKRFLAKLPVPWKGSWPTIIRVREFEGLFDQAIKRIEDHFQMKFLPEVVTRLYAYLMYIVMRDMIAEAASRIR